MIINCFLTLRSSNGDQKQQQQQLFNERFHTYKHYAICYPESETDWITGSMLSQMSGNEL